MAREKRCLPIEQAARDTRIRVDRLREVEADDYSQFASPSYARMFVIDYAKYLGLSVRDIRDELPVPGQIGAEGYDYLNDLSQNGPKVSAPRRKRRRLLPALTTLTVLLVCAVVGWKIWVTMRNIDRLGLGAPARVEKMAHGDDKALLAAGPDRAVTESARVAVPAVPEAAVPSDEATLLVGGELSHGDAAR